jgi:hypothetical protein
MHIDNLYKNQDILDFKECYAMEKIHGTSAHVRFDRETKLLSCVGEEHFGDYPGSLVTEKVTFFSGGEKHETFVALFDQEALLAKFKEILPEGDVEAYIYGEAYGGKCQGMKDTYGARLRFIAFEVKIGHSWLKVPDAEEVVNKLGLEFVFYNKIPAVMSAIDSVRDADSVQAIRNGMGPGHIREGIVLRPLFEVKKNSGERVIAKHKRSEFCETTSKREVDPTKRQALEDAQAIAQEWVTPMRLIHVLDQFPGADITKTGDVIKTMVADVVREAGEEIMDSKEARKAIGARAAKLFKVHLASVLDGTL